MNYLLEISIGPVQDFISAARRTRDLWFGSMMLSELAKAAALDVKNNHGELIFPAPDNDKDLEPDSSLSVANIILAEFKNADSQKLRDVSRSALKAAKSRLKKYADDVLTKMGHWIVRPIYEAQIDDIIEFYSAWVPVINDDYYSARSNVARLLASRKNIRNFNANPNRDGLRLPKSSLDGLRESVLIGDMSSLPEGVRIKPNESLDAIGLIKRVPVNNAAERERNKFYSITRVALSSWTRGRGSRFVNDPEFKRRYEELLQADEFDIDTIKYYLRDLEKYLPDAPYIAFICADGDKMGAALSSMKSPDEHRNFSRKLSGFAIRARNIVNNHGVCIYTGGDDVMAFVPVDKALECARSLHDLFENIMGEFGASLSVGVAIAHAMENLSMLLEYGREAESIAKKGIKNRAVLEGNDRNGLAVTVRSRGNIPFIIREQWNSNNNNDYLSTLSIDERINWFAERFMKSEIPAKFPYELRENAKFYEHWENPAQAVKADVIRIFNNKDVKLTADEKLIISGYIKSRVHDSLTLREFADELILAQWISSALKQSQENNNHNQDGE
ncbi:MAG: type III-B CRISPR-associated protein Cas10/Cmr2 [Synergistaceae bacterium]|nr:type III-B CRISPR-associated protein Cas10/Cmr2 [Synergistaceae bacterium]